MEESKKTDKLRLGIYVFIGLAVLTAIEYFLGTIEAASILLWVIALLKGALVVIYFMHIGRLFKSEGEH